MDVCNMSSPPPYCVRLKLDPVAVDGMSKGVVESSSGEGVRQLSGDGITVVTEVPPGRQRRSESFDEGLHGQGLPDRGSGKPGALLPFQFPVYSTTYGASSSGQDCGQS